MDMQKPTYEELESLVTQLNEENLLVRNKLEFHELFNQFTNVWETFRDKTGKLIYVSPSFDKITGYESADYRSGKISLFDFVHPDDQDEMKGVFQKQIKGLSISNFECRIFTKDGSLKYLSVSSQLIHDPDGCYLGYRTDCIDITEQKLAAEKIKKLNRIYSLISEINQAIVHIRDKSMLLTEICKIAVETGAFRMSWIGFINENEPGIVPFVHAGFEEGYLSAVKQILQKNNFVQGGLAGLAAKMGQYSVCNDITLDSAMSLWRDEALARSYRSSISLPIIVFRNVIGAFSIYSSVPNFFDQEEIDLLCKVAVDIGFALEVIAVEQDRFESIKKLQIAKQNLKRSQEIAKLGSWIYYLSGELSWSAQMYRIFDISSFEFKPSLTSYLDLVYPEDRDDLKSWFDSCFTGHNPNEFEFRYLHSTGQMRFYITRAEIVVDSSGDILYVNGTTQDITERRLAEKSSRENEEKYRSLYENSGIAILLTSPDGHIYSANEQACKLFDRTEEDICSLGRHCVIDTSDPNLPAFLEERKLYGHAKAELTHFRRDGSRFSCEVSSVVFVDKDGNERTSLVFYDLSERKKAELALLKSEAELKEAQRIGRIANWSYKAEDNSLIYSDAYLHIFGVDPKQLPSNYSDRRNDYTPESAAKLAELVTNSLITGETFEQDMELLQPMGNCKWCTIRGEAIKGDEDKVIGFHGTILDITARKQAELESSKALDRFSTIVQTSPQAIIVLELDFSVSLWNDAAERIFGWTHADIKDCLRPVVPDDKLEELHRMREDVFSGVVIRDLETVFKHINGLLIDVNLSASPLRDGYGRIIGILVVLSDITERKQTEKELTRYREHLEDLVKERTLELIRLNATKDKFFSIIAHDLKNPFSVLISSSELLLLYLDKNMTEKAQAKAKMIYDSSKRGFTLLQNLLEWSHSQIGSLRFSPIRVILKSFIDETLSVLENQALNKNIRIINAVPDRLSLRADPNLLQVVVRNLITNAIKFTPAGGSIWIESEEKSDSLEIAITDSGIGISSEIQDKLFRLESKITSEGTDGEVGSGLGLVLCKEFVEKHDGHIWVESSLGEGSSFKFTIPIGNKKH